MPATLSKNPKFGLLLALVSTASMWFYVQRVMIPQQIAAAAVHDSPRGNLSDLYPRWLGARELLLHHRDPYSPEVTREIQIGYYGRVLDPERAGDPKDQQAFAYPVYVVFLVAPTIGFPFAVVQVVFRWFLLILTAATVPLWLRAFRWRPSCMVTAILITLALGFFPVVQGLKLQQLTLVVSGLIAGCAVLLVGGHLLLAGILLAFATIKPQLVLPLVAWLILWACSDVRHRRQFLWGFGGTMALLLAGAQWVLPGWIGSFRLALAAYREYTGSQVSVLATVTSPAVGAILGVAAVVTLAFVCWRRRHESAATPAFALVCSLILAGTLVIIPMTALYNQVLLLPGLLFLAWNVPFFRKRDILTRSSCFVAALLFFWPMLAAVTLTTASFFLPPGSVQKAWSAPLWSSMMTPVVVLLLLVPLAATVLREER
ncbi:MAG TPA: glycosyltransferase family 87 protein [Candidatus Angelobacter sp.]|nr:glycosyltransferase family 87 protein [Candidatus Angelobacter sp.]